MSFVGRSKLQICQSINKKRILQIRDQSDEWDQTIEETERLNPPCSANGHGIKARGKANPSYPAADPE